MFWTTFQGLTQNQGGENGRLTFAAPKTFKEFHCGLCLATDQENFSAEAIDHEIFADVTHGFASPVTAKFNEFRAAQGNFSANTPSSKMTSIGADNFLKNAESFDPAILIS